jgi:hypothetical protein
MTAGEAAEWLRGQFPDNRTTRQTVARFMTKGCNKTGVLLKSTWAPGGRRVTKSEWIMEFYQERADAKLQMRAELRRRTPPMPAATSKAHEAATDWLKAQGLL